MRSVRCRNCSQHAKTMNPHEFDNYAGDNLQYDENDELDENEHFNWTNHPIRRLFDNENKAHFHPTYLNQYRKYENGITKSDD